MRTEYEKQRRREALGHTAPSNAAALAAAGVAQEAAGGSVPACLPILRLFLGAAVAQRAAAGAHLAPQLRVGCQVGAGQAGAGAQRLGTFHAQRQGGPLGWARLRLPPLLGPQGTQLKHSCARSNISSGARRTQLSVQSVLNGMWYPTCAQPAT